MDGFALAIIAVLSFTIAYLVVQYRVSAIIEKKIDSLYRSQIQVDIQEFYREMENYLSILDNRLVRFRKMLDEQGREQKNWESIHDSLKKTKSGKELQKLIDLQGGFREKIETLVEQLFRRHSGEFRKEMEGLLAERFAGGSAPGGKATSMKGKKSAARADDQVDAEADQQSGDLSSFVTEAVEALARKARQTEGNRGPKGSKENETLQRGIHFPTPPAMTDTSRGAALSDQAGDDDFSLAEEVIDGLELNGFNRDNIEQPDQGNYDETTSAERQGVASGPAGKGPKGGGSGGDGAFVQVIRSIGKAIAPAFFSTPEEIPAAEPTVKQGFQQLMRENIGGSEKKPVGPTAAKERVENRGKPAPKPEPQGNQDTISPRETGQNIERAVTETGEVRKTMGEPVEKGEPIHPEELLHLLKKLYISKERPAAMRVLLQRGFTLEQLSELSEIPVSDLELTRNLYKI